MEDKTTHRYTLEQWRRILARDMFRRLNMPEGPYVVTHEIESKGHAIVMKLTPETDDNNHPPDGPKG